MKRIFTESRNSIGIARTKGKPPELHSRAERVCSLQLGSLRVADGFLICLTIIFIFGGPIAARAQGTLKFGFEEYPIGSIPSLVLPNPQLSPPAVVDKSGLLLERVYEGEKFLYIAGSADLASPNSELISGFSLRFYMPGVPGNPRIYFGAGNTLGRPGEIGTWQLLSGTFDPPVRQFPIYGYEREGETVPSVFGIDALELMTVPEPGSLSLLLLGSACFLLFRAKGSKLFKKVRCRVSQELL